MLMDVFSHFDVFAPCWRSTFVFLLLQMSWIMFFFAPSSALPGRNLFSMLTSILSTPANQTLGRFTKSLTPLGASILFSILIFNLIGLIPETFSWSSHLILTISLSLPLWLGLILSGLSKSPGLTSAHISPKSSPNVLYLPLSFIELISLVIRPLTLALRLAANMTAGHVVLTLAAASASATSPCPYPDSITLVQAFYNAFELMICAVQAYIFCLLICLYINEHAHS